MEKVLQALEANIPNISWDNWEKEDGEGHWKVSEVLYAKLDWVIEELLARNEDGDLDEHIDTISAVQGIIEALQDYEPQQHD